MRHTSLWDLTELNAREFVDALRIFGRTEGGRPRRGRSNPLREVACALVGPISKSFSRSLLEYDAWISGFGIPAASKMLLHRFARSCSVIGNERIPERGPVLIVANHPGQTDFLAATAALPRTDIRVVAADRAILRRLPNLAKQSIFVSDDARQRAGAIREAVEHLRAGGLLLTFAAGTIEPDPALYRDAALLVDRWKESTALFARRVPGLTVVPIVIGRVLSPRILKFPILLFYRRSKRREALAAALQVALRGRYRTDVHVVCGPAFHARTPAPVAGGSQHVAVPYGAGGPADTGSRDIPVISGDLDAAVVRDRTRESVVEVRDLSEVVAEEARKLMAAFRSERTLYSVLHGWLPRRRGAI